MSPSRTLARAGALGGFLLLALGGCDRASNEAVSLDAPRVAPVVSPRVTASLPHDPEAFTQGLLMEDGYLLESTGGRGASSLRRVDIQSGVPVLQIDIPPPYFAEGMTVHGDRLYQLTWQENTGFIYDLGTLEQIGTFSYQGEGWGLTSDGSSLIMSNGSHLLRFLDPETFEVQRELAVSDGPYPVRYLNELEWVRGEIWANIWSKDDIARIDPQTGTVVGWIDVGDLAPPVRFRNSEAVANGIAYDSVSGRIFLTGKLWPVLYEVEVP